MALQAVNTTGQPMYNFGGTASSQKVNTAGGGYYYQPYQPGYLPTMNQLPSPQISIPGKTTVRYPGTQEGKLWSEIEKGNVGAAGVTERRALANQGTQADAARAAKQNAIQSSGYQDFESKRQALQPTYNQGMMDTMSGLQRNILEGQTGASKRNILASSGPGGARNALLQRADIGKAATYADIAGKLQVQKAEQDRKDELEAIDLAHQKAVMDYGIESDLAQALERIYAVTVAKTPEYNWGNIDTITNKMAEPQEYTIETEGGGDGGAGGGGEGGGFEGGGGSSENITGGKIPVGSSNKERTLPNKWGIYPFIKK